LWAEYSYLAQKIDYSVRFDRRTTSDDGEVQDIKYRLNKVHLPLRIRSIPTQEYQFQLTLLRLVIMSLT
jgi:hypothetical protein